MSAIDYGAVIAELRQHWGKGMYGDQAPDAPCCVIGAFARVVGKEPGEIEDGPIEAAILQAASAKFPGRSWWSAIAFNDDEDTTADDVIDVVEKVRAAEQVQP